MQNTVNQRKMNGLDFVYLYLVTYPHSGNSPANDLVTEILWNFVFSRLFYGMTKPNKLNKHTHSKQIAFYLCRFVFARFSGSYSHCPAYIRHICDPQQWSSY
jgi:transposase